MKRSERIAGVLRVCAVGLAVAACLVPVAGAQSDAGNEASPTLATSRIVHIDDRLDSQLGNVAVVAREQGAQAALRTARANGLDTVSGRIRVVVEATPAAAHDALATRGGIVEATAGGLTEALVSPGSIAAVSGARGVEQVRAPYTAFTLGIDSEGIETVEADAWHAAGATGAGAKVAVIDLGFAGLAGRQASGDLPALTSVDYCGSMGAPEKHGTAVAEIVYEMAPGAQLYLICVDSEVDLANASAYAKAHGITIVNHSVGWYNTSRGDGTGAAGTPDAIVASARTDGILWVNAAGNAGQEHWSGTYSDPDADDFHNFSGSDEGNSIVLFPGEEVCGFLKWDAWPTTRADYDLHLVDDADGLPVAISADDQQNGPLQPTEVVCHTNTYGSAHSFAFAINRWSAALAPRFDLFVTIADALQYTNAAGSVVEPATSPSALAVGAVAWWDNVLEPYSSVGPTIDGRVKPDLAAASAVTSPIYAPSTFTGTSSAAPHVAGAAALVRAMFPLATPAELQAFLEEEALDLGAAGADTFFGAGVLLLPASAPLVTTFAPAAGPTATASLAVSGSLSPRGMSTTYRWEYGTTTAYGSLTAPITLASPRGDQEVASTLTGLTPDTDYHYRLLATNVFGTVAGADRTAHTAVPAAPATTTSASEAVGSTQARLAGRVTSNGTASTAWFEWGTTTAYGNVTPDQSVGALGESVVVAELASLVATTEYHYRSVAENAYGQTVGADRTLTTTSATLPVATTGTATAIGTTGMTVYGDVMPGGLATSYQFDYRPVGSTVAPTKTPLAPADAGYGTAAHAVTATTTNVNPNFAYEYRLVATNALGSHVGEFKSFTISPPAPPTPPPAPPSSGASGGGGGLLDLGVTVSSAKTTLAPNETVELRVTVVHRGGTTLPATQLRALIGLPADATLVGPPAYDHGSGCTGTTQLTCYLDFLAPSATTVVRFSINVGGVATKVVTARLLQLQTDSAPTNNSASVSLDVRAPAVPVSAAPPSGGTVGPVKVLNGTSRANTLNGSAGRDILRGLGGNDRLFGRAGADRLFGGLGHDRLVGGAGVDALEGGPGRDLIEVRDGTRDVVRCGPGRDTVVADRLDWVARDCELVRRR